MTQARKEKRAGTVASSGPEHQAKVRGSKPQGELSGRGAGSESLRTAALRYIAKGWALVPVCDKRPFGAAWNTRSVMRTDKSVDSLLRKHPNANGIGVLLEESGLCSFDPDDLQRTREGLARLGIDVDEVLDSGWRIASGKANSARTLFALPKGEPLKWMRLRVRKPRDQWELGKDGVLHPTHTIVFELRAESPNLQDVLPPSKHPCGTTYTAPQVPKRMPVIAGSLLDLWRRWQADPKGVEEELYEAFGVAKEDRAPSLTGKPGKLDYPSSARTPYNEAHSVEEVLDRHGYEQHGERWAHPGATGAPGCRPIPDKDGLWHSDNGGDPLHGTFDAWTAHVVLDHAGDVQAAEREWYAEHPKGSEFAPIEVDEASTARAAAGRSISLHYGTEIVEDEIEVPSVFRLPTGRAHAAMDC